LLQCCCSNELHEAWYRWHALDSPCRCLCNMMNSLWTRARPRESEYVLEAHHVIKTSSYQSHTGNSPSDASLNVTCKSTFNHEAALLSLLQRGHRALHYAEAHLKTCLSHRRPPHPQTACSPLQEKWSIPKPFLSQCSAAQVA
jgi:hypothetical protein